MTCVVRGRAPVANTPNCRTCVVGGQSLLKKPLSLVVLVLEGLMIQPKCIHFNGFWYIRSQTKQKKLFLFKVRRFLFLLGAIWG